MKKILLGGKKYYKANLHTHTTLSDGNYSPEEIKQLFIEKGYSIVAFTDHLYTEDFNKRLSDKNFVAINGYENAYCDGDYYTASCCHLNFYAINPNVNEMVGVTQGIYNHFKTYAKGQRKEVKIYKDTFLPNIADKDNINRTIEDANKVGWLVQYNHPAWNLQDARTYAEIKGLWGVEIFNSGCVVGGFPDDNAVVLDVLLREGQRVVPVADDDCHKKDDMFLGFTMIGAKTLCYEDVITAMKEKDLYASSGPLFDEISIEDDKIIVKSSLVKRVNLITGGRYAKCVMGDIDNAQFDLPNNKDLKYFRIELVDQNGNRAYSRAFFFDEI